MADLGGAGGARPAPLGQNFFVFMQFLGKIGQIVCWRPLWGWRPPRLGNPRSATDIYQQNNEFQHHTNGNVKSYLHVLSGQVTF